VKKLLKAAVLREEAVPGVDGLSTSLLNDLKYGVHAEIGILGGRGSNAVCLISLFNKHAVTICI
jgi:hypothetical protein